MAAPHPKLKAFLKYLKTNEVAITVAAGFLLIVILAFSLVGQNWVKESRQPSIDQQAASTSLERSPVPIISTDTNLLPEIKKNEDAQIFNTQEYTVKAGDSTWAIAQQFYGRGSDYIAIEKANQLQHNQQLQIGQKLIIPALTDQKPVADTSEYSVVKGDCLWIIARDQLGDGLKWVDIYRANRQQIGRNPHLIYPGTILQLQNRK
jgi:nucleoid-associated protein YgaU